MEFLFRTRQLAGISVTVVFNLGGALIAVTGPISEVRGDAVTILAAGTTSVNVPFNSIAFFTP